MGRRTACSTLLSVVCSAGCAMEVAAPPVTTPPVVEAPADLPGAWGPLTVPLPAPDDPRWAPTPVYVVADAGSGGVLDAQARAVLAEVAPQLRNRSDVLVGVRLRAEVGGRLSCITGAEGEGDRYRRGVELEDGDFEVFYGYPPAGLVEQVRDYFVGQGIPAERIQTLLSPRLREGPPTEQARLHVFVDLFLERPAERAASSP